MSRLDLNLFLGQFLNSSVLVPSHVLCPITETGALFFMSLHPKSRIGPACKPDKHRKKSVRIHLHMQHS